MEYVLNRKYETRKITVSAPGKLMLLGEHAVMYGFPCLVTAIDTRIQTTAKIARYGKDVIVTPQVSDNRYVEKAIETFKRNFNIKIPVEVQTLAEFSHQLGFGSSSAVTVATIKALSILFNVPLSDKDIFDLGYESVLDIQGVGSGFDIAAATFGKTLYYVYGGKKIEKLETEELPLVVGYSGVKADTPTMIGKIANLYQREKEKTNSIFEKISQLVKKAKKDIAKKNYKHLGALMTENNKLLHDLGVSTEKLDAMVDEALGAEALGAKISGAGGGDCMIALVQSSKKEKVEYAITKAGGKVIDVKNAANGLREEIKST